MLESQVCPWLSICEIQYSTVNNGTYMLVGQVWTYNFEVLDALVLLHYYMLVSQVCQSLSICEIQYSTWNNCTS